MYPRSRSTNMTSKVVTLYKRFLKLFLGQFAENNIWFMAYPFFNIFKFCGFYPVRVSFEKYPDLMFHRDRKSCYLTVISMFGVTVGFIYGVNVLGQFENLGLHKSKTAIAYITSWTQIFSLFIMGILVLITSWTNTSKMRELIAKIRRIDNALEMAGAEISYRSMRKKFFIQTVVSLIIPTCLSMVNCILIKTPFKVSSSCYWFICFLPMFMLTMKELKFFNLMYLLKARFININEQLRESQRPSWNTLSVISKCSDKGVLLVRQRCKLIEQLRALSEIYSDLADCVDAVLDIFASHLLMTTCTSFAVVTIQIYNLFALVMHSLSMQWHAIGFTVAWIVVQVLVIAVNVVACSKISKVMSDTGTYLHRIKPRDDYGIFLQMVQVFSLQILQRKKPLTAGGFFDMDFKLFTSIVAAVTTYLIIIIQFHLANLQINSAARNRTTT